jgi:HEAT repeat protein
MRSLFAGLCVVAVAIARPSPAPLADVRADEPLAADLEAVLLRGEASVSGIKFWLVRPDGRPHELGEARRLRIVRDVLALGAVVEQGTDEQQRRALAAIGRMGHSLWRHAPRVEEVAVREGVRPLAPAVATRLASADVRIAEEATAAYPWVANPAEGASAMGRALERPETEVRRAALFGLGRLGEHAWPHVERVLALTANEPLREAATRAVIAMAPEPELLRGALRNLDHRVRDAAVQACARPACRALAGEVAARLVDPEEDVREHACEALGAMGAHEHALRVASRLHDEDNRTRWAAARALGKLKPAAAQVAPALGRALRTTDEQMVRECLAALEELGADAAAALPEVERLLEILPAERAGRAARAANRMSPVWHTRFATTAVDPEAAPGQRRLAIGALGAKGDPRGAAALVGVLDDPSAELQELAVDALGRIGAAAASALPRLEALSDDPARAPAVTIAARLAIVSIKGSLAREGR